MCGVPHHSVEAYIQRLIEKGYKVALCEQMSEPTPGKGLVERDVVRVITPGTVIEENMLDEHKNNFLLCACRAGERLGFAYADVSTGSFYVGELQGEAAEEQLLDELARIQPTELLVNDELYAQKQLIKRLSAEYYLQNYADWAYEERSARERLLRHFCVATLDGFGCAAMKAGLSAAGALLAYLEDTQKNALQHIHFISVLERSGYMLLNAATRRNLELTKPLHAEGRRRNTLLSLLDETKTAMGSRLLRSYVEQPLQDAAAIERRLDAVEELQTEWIKRDSLREALASVYDIERLCSKIAYGTVTARDCASLRGSLLQLPAVMGLVAGFSAPALQTISNSIDPMEDILSLLRKAIVDSPPISIKEGDIIRDDYHPEVDRLRDAALNGKQWLLELEAAEREATGIKNLRISYNKVFGYYLEVTKSYQNLVPYHYQRKQTLANAERYITPALKEMEETILGAQEQLVALEAKLFAEIRETLLGAIARLQRTAGLLAELDVYQSLAKVAAEQKYCRPAMREDGALEIKNGRHPVVERSLKDAFIPNDAHLNGQDDRLIILTGPNMAGKSTYMRQIALITLMAHMGSFVPAEEAQIPLTDRIFTRVGASDDLASGQSTFMVEMSEMANILHNATPSSLLILDEIGRGTSTFDGLSIAWAVLEHIADPALCGAKALFATHYHELTELEGRLPGVKNYRITVKEVGEDILFLRKIMRGGADKSFGIQVARLAGLPASILQRAKELLAALELADINRAKGKKRMPAEPQQQLSLLEEEQKGELCRELSMIDVDQLSPIEALNTLNLLHQRAKKIGRGQ